MHMADALVSTPVAAATGIAAVILTAVAGKEIKKDHREGLVPLMGVMGAFIFAAQMINFAIPATGSSGHIVGGILLSSMLGPWAAFITLVSVLLIQSLVFADGGLLALGCNILNMAACSCLVIYPLVFRPLMRYPASKVRIFWVSILASVVSLEMGACGVSLETELSGVSALSTGRFLALMTGIHLFIGIGEGLATAAVICFVQQTRPSLLVPQSKSANVGTPPVPVSHLKHQWNMKKILLAFGCAALLLGGVIAFFASGCPDGLEWSIREMTGSTEPSQAVSALATQAAAIQNKTAFLPDYENAMSGVVGALITLSLAWGLGSLFLSRRRAQLKPVAEQPTPTTIEDIRKQHKE